MLFRPTLAFCLEDSEVFFLALLKVSCILSKHASSSSFRSTSLRSSSERLCPFGRFPNVMLGRIENSIERVDVVRVFAARVPHSRGTRSDSGRFSVALFSKVMLGRMDDLIGRVAVVRRRPGVGIGRTLLGVNGSGATLWDNPVDAIGGGGRRTCWSETKASRVSCTVSGESRICGQELASCTS